MRVASDDEPVENQRITKYHHIRLAFDCSRNMRAKMLQNVQGTWPTLILILFRWRHTQGLTEIFLVNPAYFVCLIMFSPVVALNHNGDLIPEGEYF